MAKTFQDLELEVAKLRKQVRKLQGDPNVENQRQADELTGASDEKSDRQGGLHTGSGFGALAGKVREQSHKNNWHAAVNFVRAKLPGTPNTEYLKAQIFETYGFGGNDLDAIISQARERA